MIKDFLIISFTGKNDIIGLRVNNNFFIKKIQINLRNNNSKFVNNIQRFVSQKGANINEDFSVIVNMGPGSFSGIRISIAIAKAMKIVNGVRLFGFKDTNLNEFVNSCHTKNEFVIMCEFVICQCEFVKFC